MSVYLYTPLLSQLQKAEERENVQDQITALNGLAMALSRKDVLQQYETLRRATALVESESSSNRAVFKHTFYRFGLACSAVLQTTHYTVYSASKKAGGHFAEKGTGDKKDHVRA